MKALFYLAVLLLSMSCSQPEQAIDHTHLKVRFDSIATVSQQLLLNTVQLHMKKGGPTAAVEYCNVYAVPLTDSLSNKYKVKISRISDRNRNPTNIATNDTERDLLKMYTEGFESDTIVVKDNHLTYYKPIKTALAACLQCHGKPNEDIKPQTLALILEKYPADKATGYALNDFRGLWKVESEVPATNK